MTKNNTNGLDESIKKIFNVGHQGTLRYEHDVMDFQDVYDAKKAILQWIADEVIGTDGIDPKERWRYSPEYTAIDDFRINQRNILKSHGFIEGGK